MTVVCTSPEDHYHSQATASSQIFQDWSVGFKNTPKMSTAVVKQELLPRYFYGVGLTSSSVTLEVTPIGVDLLSFFPRNP